MEQIEHIKSFFADIFTKEPWNDDWSKKDQLHQYILDLIAERTSLTLVFFDGDTMIGLFTGWIRHWYTGTEYNIQELCIKRDMLGKGTGTQFIKQIQSFLTAHNIHSIFLETERNVPAYSFYKKQQFYELTNHVAFALKF